MLPAPVRTADKLACCLLQLSWSLAAAHGEFYYCEDNVVLAP